MKEDFVTHEIAKRLKENGFKFQCFARYSNSVLYYNTGSFTNCFNGLNEDSIIDAPTISQVLKWLRETKSIHLEICTLEGCWACPIVDLSKKDEDCDLFAFCVECLKGGYKSYEEAAIAGITYCLENLI